MATAKFALFATILFASTCALYADVSPFLVLNSEEINRKISSLSIVSEESLQDIVSETCGGRTCIVFAADELSPMHLGHRSDNGVTSYENLSKLPSVFYAPYVQSPLETMQKMYENKTEESYVDSTCNINKKINLDENLVILSLRSRQEGQTLHAYLAQQDRCMAHIMDNYASEENVRFIYCGRQNKQVLSRKVRAAAPAEGSAVGSESRQHNGPQEIPTFFKRPNLLVYYLALVATYGKEARLIEVTDVKVSGVTIDSLTAELIGNDSINIKLTFMQRSGYWFVADGNVNDNAFIGVTPFGANRGFSYHCSPATSFRVANSTSTHPSLITIKGLQIQPLFEGDSTPLTKFAPAQDCVGFTSAGIWAGLFVVIMLLGIMSIGITWIMDIRTMDRFDDPKGKTITISATE